MEAVLALNCCQSQFLFHDLLVGVVRQLEIVGASHHTGQIVVWLHFGRVKSLLDNGEGRRERFVAANGKSGTACDELEERSLLLLVVFGHNQKEVLDALTVHIVTMIRFTGVAQHLRESTLFFSLDLYSNYLAG